MTNHNYLIELFLYFAKFPQRDGISPLFNVGSSSIDGYSQLQAQIMNMKEHSLMDIKNYIFGANIASVTSRINNITSGSDYLFVDFGEIDCSVDSKNTFHDSSRLAITVAYRLKNFSGDIIEQMLAYNHSLQKITDIRKRMYADQRCNVGLDMLSDTHQLLPFSSLEMSSIGWSLIFTREGHDTFNIKGK